MSGKKGQWRTATIYNLQGSKLQNGRPIKCNFLRVKEAMVDDPGAGGGVAAPLPAPLYPTSHSVARFLPAGDCAAGLAPGAVVPGSSGIGIRVVLPIN